jgi:hypothetical protein
VQKSSTLLQRSTSQQSLSASVRPLSVVKRSNSLEAMHDARFDEKTTIPCDALRYVDMAWYRGERGAKSAKGYLVVFNQFRSEGEQDTAAGDIKLRQWWWRSLKDEDCISLEPLSRLKYEPFELPSSAEKTNWFDGKVLANYLISSANFLHPVSRRPLERSEMVRLDEYLAKNSLGKAMVVHVFDRKDDSSENAINHVTALRREATDLLGALFARNPASVDRVNERRGPLSSMSRPNERPEASSRSENTSQNGMGSRSSAQGSNTARGAKKKGESNSQSREQKRRGESYERTMSRLRAAAHVVIADEDISSRNQELVKKMKSCLSDAAQRLLPAAAQAGGQDGAELSQTLFAELRGISGDFRAGVLDGREYASRLFEIFGYREASMAERNAVDDTLVELLALLPDRDRRVELASASADWVQQLSIETQHLVSSTSSSSTRVSDDRLARAGVANVHVESGVVVEGGGPALGPVLEPHAFPSLDGSLQAPSVTGVFGGAWLSRRADLSEQGAILPSGPSPAAAEWFPSLTSSQPEAGTGRLGVWGGGPAAHAAAMEPAEPPAPVTRKTKRGTLLLF